MRLTPLLLVPLALAAAAAPAAGQVARYRLTVDNTWSAVTHPGAFPPFAHFSSLGGGTHDASVSFWDVGQLASPGMVEMAETGGLVKLSAEVGAAVAAGSAWKKLIWPQWFCPPGASYGNCGTTVVEFDVLASHSLVTLVTMIGPSPDWFVGVSGLPLRDAAGWIDRVEVDLRPYDGGTRSDNVFALGGTLTVPPDPITPITVQSGQLIGPGSLGSFTFERLVAKLTADVTTVSVGAGGTQTFALDAGAENAGRLYWLLGSASGTSPGLPGPPDLPLNLDLYLLFTVQFANVPPFVGTLGFLDPQGRATAAFDWEADDDTSLVGLHLDHAYVVVDLPGTGASLYTSDPVGLDLVP